VDEDSVKESLLKERASPTIISKNLAELKANKISQKFVEEMVLGADSVIDLEGKIISKPNDRAEALEILKRLNGKSHQLISSVCISRGGSMIWNYTDKASLTMKNMTFLELEDYLKAFFHKLHQFYIFLSNNYVVLVTNYGQLGFQ
jgi:septum formation protein